MLIFAVCNSKKSIIKDLYNVLEALRYPEIAQINFEEFVATILTENKRVELLHWLLQKNQNFNSTLLNKFKESSLEDKLFKYYSQMGFCSSKDILLGKCNIDEQLDFLSLLTLFIKRIYLSESQSPREIGNNSMKALIVSPSTDCSNEEKSNFKIEIEKQQNDLQNMCCDIKLSLEELNKHKSDTYEPQLDNFYKSFKNVTSIPLKNSHPSKSSDDLNNHFEHIHTTFSVINKALNNEVEFKNRLVPENNEKATNPLNLIISNNVVLIEQACNMFKENQMLS